MIGNSSSGLVEVPFLGTESIIIGLRQKVDFPKKVFNILMQIKKKNFFNNKKNIEEKKSVKKK